MFHHFHGPDHPRGQGSLSADDLETLLDGVARDRLIPAREWARLAVEGRLDDQVCLTFDDTLLCQYEIARPILDQRGLTGFWFITTSVLRGRPLKLELYRAFRTQAFQEVDDFYEAFFRFLATSDDAEDLQQQLAAFNPSTHLAQFSFYSEADRRFRYVRDDILGPRRFERIMDAMILAHGLSPDRLADRLWMSPDNVLELHQDGHVIGLHSDTHPTRLAELPQADQRREYRDNLTELMALVGERPRSMAHPCNSYGPETLAVLRELGVQLGFRADTTSRPSSPLETPRLDHTLALQEVCGCASPS